MLVKRLHDDSVLPAKGIIGYDIFSYETLTIPVGSKMPVRTGVALALARNMIGLILTIHSDLCGLIAPVMRDELVLMVPNYTDQPFTVYKGSKVATMFLTNISDEPVLEVPAFSEGNAV